MLSVRAGQSCMVKNRRYVALLKRPHSLQAEVQRWPLFLTVSSANSLARSTVNL